MLNLHGEPNKVELDVQVSPAGKTDSPQRAGLGGKSTQEAECPSPFLPLAPCSYLGLALFVF